MKRSKISRKQIINELADLGICQGDVLFISANLLRVGYFRSNSDETLKDWVEILKELVGSTGTIVLPAYTRSFFRYGRNKNIIFDLKTPPNEGSLIRAIHKFGSPLRSHHPTNSCFAIGPEAQFILEGHDANSTSYAPYGRVIELGGKNLMLGTLDKANGPMAFHYAQEVLGHTKNHPMCGLLQVYYFDKYGTKKLFTRRDIGGCTGGAYKTLGHHISSKAISFHQVGKSLSALIDTRISYKILKEILQKDPSFIRCDNTNCISCYGRFIYNPVGFFPFWVKTFISNKEKILK